MNQRHKARAVLVAALVWGTGGLCLAQVPQGIFTDVRNTGFGNGINTPFVEYETAVSPDGKELYFATYGNVDPARVPSWQGDADTWVATRKSLSEPFGDVKNLQDLASGIVLNSSAAESPGAISYDLRDLYFTPHRFGTWDAEISVGRRAGPGALFASVVKLGPKVNAPDMNSACAAITSDGLTLFYHRNVSNPSPGVLLSQSDIWIASRESTDDLFGDENGPDPRPLEVNSPIYDEFRPSISADGKFLFFSDWLWTTPRPGGFGQGDIWVATRSTVEDRFGEPVNFNVLWPGSDVNSTFLDGMPFISAD